MANDETGDALHLASNQSKFRDANERLGRSALSYRFETATRIPFTCECPDPNCREVVMLRFEEYERIRARPTWFLLVAGHEDDDSPHELIVEAEAGYAIVAKVGAAGVEAARLDPRQIA